MNMITSCASNLNAKVREFFADESGISTIELVLILVVLVGLVIVFKGQINTLLKNIFDAVNSSATEVYG